VDKTILVFAFLIILAGPLFADSDSTGLIAGSNENLILALSNSSGHFDSESNCSIIIYAGTVLTLNYSLMANIGDGRHLYAWTVPDELGVYQILFNCTTLSGENYTAGGSAYVVRKSLKKVIENAVVSEAGYGGVDDIWWNRPEYMLIVGVVVLCLLLVIAKLINYGGKRS